MTEHLLPDDWLDWDTAALAALAPVQRVPWPAVEACGVAVAIKREDLLHPRLGGNKIYKLHGHLRAARRLPGQPVLSFGGAWSNHLYALAAAGRSLGFSTIGVVRGQGFNHLSATLTDAAAMGMRLHFVSRADYQEKTSPQFLAALRNQFGAAVVIPEGGGGDAGVSGVVGWGAGLGELARRACFDTVCCAVGTGSTLAGLAAGVPQEVTVEGISVLRGGNGMANEVSRQLEQAAPTKRNWHLHKGFHCGGYARINGELLSFMQAFEQRTHVPLDPVYTGKLMWGIEQLARAGHWPRGTHLLAIHSGGLQGRRGFPQFAPVLD